MTFPDTVTEPMAPRAQARVADDEQHLSSIISSVLRSIFSLFVWPYNSSNAGQLFLVSGMLCKRQADKPTSMPGKY